MEDNETDDVSDSDRKQQSSPSRCRVRSEPVVGAVMAEELPPAATSVVHRGGGLVPSVLQNDDEDEEDEGHLSDFVVSDEELDLQAALNHSGALSSLGDSTLNLSHASSNNTGSNATQKMLQQLQQNEDTSSYTADDELAPTRTQSAPSSPTRPEKQFDGVLTSPADNTKKNRSIPQSASLFRYLRSLTGVRPTSHDEGAESESSDDDDVFDNESSWGSSDDDSLGSPGCETIDWNRLPVLPNRFVVNDDDRKTPRTPYYLDPVMLEHNITIKEANEFVYEHGTLLQAVLQLLAERDHVGVEDSMESMDNIMKKGPLKKLSFGVGRRRHQRPATATGTWKVKYVEIRQGNLCYYEDNHSISRKTIHLRQGDAVVQESTLEPGFVFELLVQGSPTQYWMASSETNRQLWMKAISNAMIGDEGPVRELDLQVYQESLAVYTSLRDSLQQADTQRLYITAIQSAIKELASLQVPVQWVREQIEGELSPLLLGTLKPPKFGRSPQKRLKSSIADFWKSMGLTTFTINGLTIPRESHLASERIMGALTRCILEFDKAFEASDLNRNEEEAVTTDTTHSQITELQAVSYARHILLSVLRSKERQDIACAVKYLLENPFVALEQNLVGDEPVQIEVSFAGEDLPDDFLPELGEEMATWVWTRTRRKNIAGIYKQRHTYAVLSGTVLSFYEAASPRPHGLRGQLVLNSTMTVKEEGEDVGDADSSNNNSKAFTKARFGLCISSERLQDRLLSFETAEEAAAWKEAITEAIRTADSVSKPPRVVTTTTTTSSLPAPTNILKGAERAIKVAADGGIRVFQGAKHGGIRVIKGAKDGGIRVIKNATGTGFKVIRDAVGRLRQSLTVEDFEGDGAAADRSRRPSLDILLNNTIVHGKREPTVQCVIRTLQTFTIKNHGLTDHSTEQEGTEPSSSEAWMSVKAQLYQAFLMSGGPSGRIARGNALVELQFVETSIELDEDGSC